MKIDKTLLICFLVLLLSSCSPEISPAPPSRVTPQETIAAREAAPAGEWEKMMAASRKEGLVNIYGSTGAAASRDTLIKAAKERFGLRVEMIVGRGAELSARIFSERKAGIYMADVYIGGAGTMVNVLIPGSVFEPIEPVLILPEVKDPRNWFGGNLPLFESTRTAFRMASWVENPVAINTLLASPEELKSYRDLLNTKWRGKIVMNDPSVAGQGSLFFYFVGNKIMGLDFMRELAKQEPTIIRDQRLQAEWLARGRYAILLGGQSDSVREMQRGGAPLKELHPVEGTYIMSEAAHTALFTNAPHPNAARLFINWLLSKEGETAWSQSQDDVSLRKDVPRDHLGPIKVPDPTKKYIIEDESTIKDRPEYYTVAAEIFSSSLRR